MRLKNPAIVAAMALTVGLALPRASAAQQGQKHQAPKSVKVDQALLKKFVAVYPEITTAETRMRQKIKKAGKSASQKIQMETQAEIQQIFKQHHMTLAQYKAVVQKLNSDPAFMKKFRAMLSAEENSGG